MPPTGSFVSRVYALVRRVPRGRVVTYGQVAAMLGHPRAARAVGTALRKLDGPLLGNVPWQRVVNAAGAVSRREGFGPMEQRERLRREGVRFDRHGRVDLERARWEPSRPGRSGAARERDRS